MRALIDHHPNLYSSLHCFHPRYKWLAFFAAAISVSAVTDLAVAGVAFAMVLVLVAVAKLPWRLVAGRAAAVGGMLAFLVVFVGLTARGDSAEAWSFALLMAAKCLTVVLLSTVLLATTSTVQLFKALRDLYVPARFVEVLLMSFRLVFAMEEEVAALRRAAVCRGYRMTVSPRDLRTTGQLGGAVLVRAFDRSERLHRAMLARGYDGTARAMAAPPATTADGVKLVVAVVLAAGLHATRWWG